MLENLFQRSFWQKIWRNLAGPPLTGWLLDEHKQLILYRSKIGTIAAAAVYVTTTPIYFSLYYPDQIPAAMASAIVAALVNIGLYFSLRLKFIQEHYQLPLILVLAVTANGLEVTLLQLSGGASGMFFFPYFLTFIGMAIYFPGSFGWILFISAAIVLGYPISEGWMGRELRGLTFTSNVMYLINSAFLCIVGNRIIYRLFIRDREHEKALQEANTKLKSLDQAKSVFFANVSHELKTPMTLVVTPLDNALRKLPKNDAEVILPRQTFETVRHNAYRLSGLISDLLDLTKGEIGKARINPVEIEDTRGYFEGIFNSVTPLMQEKGLQFEFVVGPPEPKGKKTE